VAVVVVAVVVVMVVVVVAVVVAMVVVVAVVVMAVGVVVVVVVAVVVVWVVAASVVGVVGVAVRVAAVVVAISRAGEADQIVCRAGRGGRTGRDGRAGRGGCPLARSAAPIERQQQWQIEWADCQRPWLTLTWLTHTREEAAGTSTPTTETSQIPSEPVSGKSAPAPKLRAREHKNRRPTSPDLSSSRNNN
jgi:hypothetical protein